MADETRDAERNLEKVREESAAREADALQEVADAQRADAEAAQQAADDAKE